MGVRAGDRYLSDQREPDTGEWRLVLFGGWSLNGREPPHHLRRREKRLLAYLGLHGPVPRMVAAEALWPETTERHALANLRTTCHQIRRTCAGLLAQSLESLDVCESTLVDVRQFRALAEPDEATGLTHEARDRILLGNAALLPGWYDDWVLSEQERLTHQRLLRLEDECLHALAEDDPPRALRLARCAAELDPLCESAQRALIQVHLRMGNRVRALRVYHEFCVRSRREYGIDPSPLLVQLIQPLLGGRAVSSGGRAGPPGGRRRG